MRCVSSASVSRPAPSVLLVIGAGLSLRHLSHFRGPAQLATATGPYLFPGRNGGHLTDIKKTWQAVRSAASLPDVRLHDLRHTYASLLASAGQSLPIIGALLGHPQPQTAARYAPLLDDPLRAATNQVGALLTNGITSNPTVLKT